MTTWFDSHGHLNDERFDEDRQQLIRELPALGIVGMIVVGYDDDPKRSALTVARMAPWAWTALGVHPMTRPPTMTGWKRRCVSSAGIPR